MNQRLVRSATGMIALSLLGVLPVCAETNYLWPRYSLTAGSYRITKDDTIRVDASLTGTPVGLDADFGLPDSESLTTFGLDWGFAARHSLGFRYYSLDRDGSRTLDRVLEIGDVEFPVGARLDASSETTSIEAFYDYWFVRNDNFGVAGSLGLVYLSLDVSATGTVTLGSSGRTEIRQASADTDLPVPMIGLALKGRPWSRLVIYADGRYLPSVQIGDVDGEAGSYSLGADLYLFGPFAVGASYDGTFYKVDLDQPHWHGSVDLNTEGWRGYVRLSF